MHNKIYEYSRATHRYPLGSGADRRRRCDAGDALILDCFGVSVGRVFGKAMMGNDGVVIFKDY